MDYLESSCTTCAYAQQDFDRNQYHFNIGCKYPFFGDIREREDRENILVRYHNEFIANAKECGCWLNIEETF